MSKRARADVLAACEWWKRNLPDAHVPLIEELRRARQQLAATPWAGVSVSDEEGVLTPHYFAAFEAVRAVDQNRSVHGGARMLRIDLDDPEATVHEQR